jgi:limonene-1,2-epoxide hydrolase
MESPIDVVRRFCAAWSDNVSTAELVAFFADNAVYQNIPLATITGREAIATNVDSFIRPGRPGIEAIEFRLVNIAANGPVVMTERIDVFKLSETGRSSYLSWGLSRSTAARSAPGGTISTRTSSTADREQVRSIRFAQACIDESRVRCDLARPSRFGPEAGPGPRPGWPYSRGLASLLHHTGDDQGAVPRQCR